MKMDNEDSLFYINDDIGSLDIDMALASVSPQRREQALRFSREQGRRLCLSAYLLLKDVLAQEYGFAENPLFGYHEGGKPFIIGRSDIHFSLSHCRRAVACAVGPEPVGVDIETIRPYKPVLARHVLSDDELRRVEMSLRPGIAFIKLWTMKESLLKMTGEGIRGDLRRLSLQGARFTTTVNMARGYVCTVCRATELSTSSSIQNYPNK